MSENIQLSCLWIEYKKIAVSVEINVLQFFCSKII